MTNIPPIHQATNCFRNEDGEWFATIRHGGCDPRVEIGDEVCVNGRKDAQWLTTIIAIKERKRDSSIVFCGQPPWSPDRETVRMERAATARRALLDVSETEELHRIRGAVGVCLKCGEFADDCACKRRALAEAEQRLMNTQAEKAREEQDRAEAAERKRIDTILATLTDERWEELTAMHGDDIGAIRDALALPERMLKDPQRDWAPSGTLRHLLTHKRNAWRRKAPAAWTAAIEQFQGNG